MLADRWKQNIVKWESFEEPWHQNAASGEFFAGSCYSFFATSGVLVSEFFEEIPLYNFRKLFLRLPDDKTACKCKKEL